MPFAFKAAIVLDILPQGMSGIILLERTEPLDGIKFRGGSLSRLDFG